ncbi:XTP/dITP diphosphatase [Fusibacter paucivorans]|uniref:dITP/XTP pyrophosphatase n=1 Tax=Fusibacter paucivorans TaxID=76009 RepID=A0ABS5PKG8_9FIRM|nr:XTP/dITP diphosphatase [Fusibacter paucivorans]MBS7525598.1 XTP/dITP diphosphatase [Fusibacter paucivorans]
MKKTEAKTAVKTEFKTTSKTTPKATLKENQSAYPYKAVLASGNSHKRQEIQAMLKDFDYEILSLKDVGLENMEIVEDGDTFEANAVIKAKAVQREIGGVVLADDSGLEVDALGGAPGVYSARYAGEHGNDEANNLKLIKALEEVEPAQRTARFVSVIAMIFEDGETITARGTVEGIIQLQPVGDNGFGYDPLFYYPPFQKTMAELTMSEKNAVSHRGNALALLRQKLEAKYAGLHHQ